MARDCAVPGVLSWQNTRGTHLMTCHVASEQRLKKKGGVMSAQLL